MPTRAIFTGIDLESKKQRTVRHYRGTTPYSVRNPVSKEEVKRSLKRLKLDYDSATKEIRPKVSEEQFQKRVLKAERFADKNGDLIRRYHDDRLCFGVPHWRAMSLACQFCGSRKDCDSVVALRLMYGGVDQFKAALSNIDARKRRYDRNAKIRSQGYELEVSDPDIRDLRVLHAAYWKRSDETFGHRKGWVMRQHRERMRKKFQESRRLTQLVMYRFEGKSPPTAQEVLEAVKEIDNPTTEKYLASISDGRLEGHYQEYERFRQQNSHQQKWRKMNPARLALVKVCRDAIAEVQSPYSPSRYKARCKDVHENAVDLLGVVRTLHPELVEKYGTEDMSYNQVHRLLNTISKIEGASKVSSPEEE